MAKKPNQLGKHAELETVLNNKQFQKKILNYFDGPHTWGICYASFPQVERRDLKLGTSSCCHYRHGVREALLLWHLL